jgi:chemotaxis protein MotA
MALVGIIIVLASVAGGFTLAGGHFGVLLQPSEFVVIIGAAIGVLMATASGKMRGRVLAVVKHAFKDATPKKEHYVDLLKLLYTIFQEVRRNGALALEPHLGDPTKSAMFRKYPSVIENHHALEYITDALSQMVNGVEADDLEGLLDADIDTFKEQGHLPITLLKTVGDALPGIGIVAAVLGIIVTMGHMDAPPAVIGHHVAAALVGTFLGILLCYGIIQPLAGNVELQEAHQVRYLQCIKAGLVASTRGASPMIATEFARKAIYSDERPTARELDKVLQSVKG